MFFIGSPETKKAVQVWTAVALILQTSFPYAGMIQIRW